MTDAVVLDMRGVTKAFPGVLALNGVDLTLRAGEVHVLLGENGAGKSTLMKVLSGASRMDAGEIRIDGAVCDIQTPADALELGVRIIYQELSLVPALSIAENVFLGRLPTTYAGVTDRRTLHAAARDVLDALGLDHLSPATPVHALSLAHRQMVEIAKALKDTGVSGPTARILVMDEPTSALTSREVDRLFALIARLTARGVAVVYITHRLDEVYRIGQRVTVLRDGRRVATHALADVTLTELVRLMANRDVAEHFPRVRQAPGDVLLSVDGVSRAGTLHDISFTVRAGEVVGIAGVVGAGRSELARVIAGADPAHQGRILIGGTPVTLRTPRDAIRRGIGLLPEDRGRHGLVPGGTVARNVALPHVHRLARAGVLARGADEAFARPVAEALRIKAHPAQPVRLLSGGNQQKVVLGKWLAGNARLVIFDEPTRGVDVGAKEEIYQLINRLTADGAGVIMISSEMPELLGMSDRILVMHAGRVCAEFDGPSATQERVMAAALGVS